MDGWFRILLRVAGSSFGFTAPLVQLDAELTTRDMQQRLLKLEDPISALHPDVRDVSRIIYSDLRNADSLKLEYPDHFYEKYARVLALLESRNLIRGTHAIGQRYFGGFRITDAEFVLYMAGLYEDADKLDFLVKYIDQASGGWLRGEEIAAQVQVPIVLVKAIFELYEARGLGVCSKQIGATLYRPIA